MNVSCADHFITAAVAAERRGRFLAEATHARRLNQLPRRSRGSNGPRFILALWNSARSGMTRAWGGRAVGWRHQLSLFGEG